MGQNGSSFYLDSINVSGKPLSCEVKAGTTLALRNNCDDVSFSYNGSESDIKIYVQLDDDQGTWTYNTSSKTFTDARRGIQNVTDTNEPVYTDGYISLSTNGSSFNTNDYIDLSVRMYNSAWNTDTSNRDQVRFTILRQSGSAYYNASSSDYYLRNTTYTFTSSDRGNVTLDDYVRFYTNGTYKIRVENTNTGRTSESIVTIWNGGSSSDTITSSFDVGVSRTNPTRDQYIDTTVTARDRNGNRVYSYVGTIRFVVEKRDTNSSFWYSASTSDYTMSTTSRYLWSTQQGTISLSDHLRFSNNGNYRVRVYDSANSDINGYKEITVWGNGNNTSNNNVHGFVGSVSPRIPELYDTIGLNIIAKDSNNSTVTNMTDRVTLSIERKLLPTSNVWTKVGITTACKLNTTSHTFNSSDYGQANLTNVVRCTKKWFYRIKITNSANSNVLWYVYFTIVDTDDFVNNLSGFTSSQREQVQEEYRTFMAQVNEWEAQYPRLSYNTQWNNLWKNYYIKLNKLAYNKSGRLVNYAAYERARDTFNSSFNTIR